MKWHSFGNGNVQLRLWVGLVGADGYLCHVDAKTSAAQDERIAGPHKDKIELIRAQRHDERGELP